MARTKFKNILQNCIFYNNTKADNSNNSYKVRLLITNFDKKFSQYAPNWALKTLMSTCLCSSIKKGFKKIHTKFGFKF